MGSLELESQAEAGVEGAEQFRRQWADSFGEPVAVDRQQLRNLDDGILRQAGGARRAEYVAGRIGARQVRGHRGDDRGAEPGAVERIALDDHDRPAKPWLGSSRFLEIRPPDFASSDHQSDAFSVRRAAEWRKAASSSVSGAA